MTYQHQVHMHVYVGSHSCIVVESNLEWALPYWQERKRLNPLIRWEFK